MESTNDATESGISFSVLEHTYDAQDVREVHRVSLVDEVLDNRADHVRHVANRRRVVGEQRKVENGLQKPAQFLALVFVQNLFLHDAQLLAADSEERLHEVLKTLLEVACIRRVVYGELLQVVRE